MNETVFGTCTVAFELISAWNSLLEHIFFMFVLIYKMHKHIYFSFNNLYGIKAAAYNVISLCLCLYSKNKCCLSLSLTCVFVCLNVVIISQQQF